MASTSDRHAVPAKVVAEDHRLDSAATKATESLARHRWHWTLDESNPVRVSFGDYARAVGRHRRRIAKMANAYGEWGAQAPQDRLDLQDVIDLQNVAQADQEIVTAVAKATGTSVNDVRNRHKGDVERVRNAVADAREAEPDTFTPEREQEIVHRSASVVAASRKAEKARKEQRRKSTPLQVLVVEGDLQRAREALTKALEDTHSLDLDGLEDEFVASLRDAIDRVVALAKLVQSALGNTADVNWDAELAKITGDTR